MSTSQGKVGTTRFGSLARRYAYMLNPFPDVRLSKCPKCQRLTFQRKFPLVIVVRGWGPYVQGKTCKYCSRCELIMCQQAELEEQLTQAFTLLSPEVIGEEYFVVGTVATKVWKRAMEGPAPELSDALKQVADFKSHLDLEVDPGGWRLPDSPPRYREPVPPPTSWRSASKKAVIVRRGDRLQQ